MTPEETIDTAAAEQATTDATPDFDAMTPAELQAYLNPEEVLSAEPTEEAPEEAPDETAEPEEAAEDVSPAEADILAFAFTENADAETFRDEADTFLAQVELIPQVEAVLNHYRTAAQAAEAQVAQFDALGDYETTRRTIGAFNSLLEFRQDEDSGEFVPDARGVVELVNKDFRAEKPQILLDLNTQPSEKYPGVPVFQEFIKDHFSLDDAAMDTLNQFFNNGGHMPTPNFTPVGVREENAEAYWKSFERESIQRNIESHVWTVQSGDATESEKQSARQSLIQINNQLAREQAGLNAEKTQKQSAADFQTQTKTRLVETATAQFQAATDAIADSLSAKLAKALPFVEGVAADLTADAVVAIVRQAYSERDWEANSAQARLQAKGITHDWAKGRGLLDNLYNVEAKLTWQQNDKNTNPRSIELSKKAKADLVRQLRAEELEIVGKITRSVIGGANKSLQNKVANAPKVQAVRARVQSHAGTGGPRSNHNNKSLEQLRHELSAQNPYRAAVQGDLNALA